MPDTHLTATSKLTSSPQKIPVPRNDIEVVRMTQLTKKINRSAKSSTHIIFYPIVLTILGKRAAIISRPFSGAFRLIFKFLLCPARSHSRETDGEFDT